MLNYSYNTNAMEIEESENEIDVEFRIRIIEDTPHVENIKRVREHFEDNEVYTDVLFYVYPNHEYIIHVRKDYYTAFIAELFKNQLIQSVEWDTRQE